jgi:Spy/CpxP family protein refolding chaperone
MGPRLAILFSAGALALASSLPASAAEKASISYPSKPAAKAVRPAVIQGQRNVLEMVAERLDLSDRQKIELQSLLKNEQEQVAELHQDLKATDAQKSAKYRQIRLETKNSFVAVLTQEQRREFNRIMGR